MSGGPHSPARRRKRPAAVQSIAPAGLEPEPGRAVGPGLDEDERIERLEWSRLRRRETKRLFNAFYILNAVVFSFVFIVWLAEFLAFRGAGSAAFHVISDKVVLALIGGSSVQLGALALAVGKGLIGKG